jgi:hypothetical protein
MTLFRGCQLIVLGIQVALGRINFMVNFIVSFPNSNILHSFHSEIKNGCPFALPCYQVLLYCKPHNFWQAACIFENMNINVQNFQRYFSSG